MTPGLRGIDPAGHRHYLYPPTSERLVSVTTVLDATDGKHAFLVPWSARLTAEFAVDNLEALSRTLAAEGRAAAVELTKNQSRRIRDIKADAGSWVHDVVEALILWAASPDGTGSDIPLPVLPDHLAGASYDGQPLASVVDWMVGGFLNFVTDWRPQFHAAEMTVYNRDLGYAGTLDIIGALPGLAIGASGRFIAGPAGQDVVLCIDVKTGKYLSVTWREQIAAYRRASECLLPMGDLAPMPVTEAAAVLQLRPELPRGYRLMLIAGPDDMAAWMTFQSALRVYHDRAAARPKPGKVCQAARPDGTIPPPALEDLDGEGYGRVLAPLMRAGISDLEQLAGMAAGDLLRVKGVGGKTLDTIRVMLADHGLRLTGEAA